MKTQVTMTQITYEITYETDELKKSNRKNVNTVKKKGRMAKAYTMNIEEKDY